MQPFILINHWYLLSDGPADVDIRALPDLHLNQLHITEPPKAVEIDDIISNRDNVEWGKDILEGCHPLVERLLLENRIKEEESEGKMM